MLKKITAGLLAIMMILGSGVLPEVNVLQKTALTASAEGDVLTYGDYKYVVLDDGTVEITHYKGEDTEIDIPAEIDGKSVTIIGYQAFYHCSDLTVITIPDSVTSIDFRAFLGAKS